MTGLQWTNAVLLASAATMAMMMGVVCLLYGIYLDEAPQLRENWPVLTQSALIFAALTAISGVAFYGLLRNKTWRWYGQAAVWPATVLSGWLLWKLLTE